MFMICLIPCVYPLKQHREQPAEDGNHGDDGHRRDRFEYDVSIGSPPDDEANDEQATEQCEGDDRMNDLRHSTLETS